MTNPKDGVIERLRFVQSQGGGYYELAQDCIDLIEAMASVGIRQETELTQLRGNLSLAEEGLASYALEVQRLKDACKAYVAGIAAHEADEAEAWAENERLRAVIDSRDKALGFVEVPSHEPIDAQVQEIQRLRREIYLLRNTRDNLADNVDRLSHEPSVQPREWHFDRYRNGKLMAEGVVVCNKATFEEALEWARCQYPPFTDTFKLREQCSSCGYPGPPLGSDPGIELPTEKSNEVPK